MPRSSWAALALCAFARIAHAQFETINSNAIGLRYFNDIPSSLVSVSQNSYPSILRFDESFPQAAPAAGANRHIGVLSENGSTPFAIPHAVPWFYSVTIRMEGSAAREAGLHIGSLGAAPPWNLNANTGVLMVNADNGEIAAFGGWLPFFTSFDPALSFLPDGARDQDFRLGIHVVPVSPTVVTAQYFINGFTVGPLNLDPGAVQAFYGAQNSASVYAQNAWRTTGPTAATTTFRDFAIIPSPAAAACSFGFAVLITTRRCRPTPPSGPAFGSPLSKALW